MGDHEDSYPPDEDLFRAASNNDSNAFSILCSQRISLLMDILKNLSISHKYEPDNGDLYRVAESTLYTAVDWVRSNGYVPSKARNHEWLEAIAEKELQVYFRANSGFDPEDLFALESMVNDIDSLVQLLPPEQSSMINFIIKHGSSSKAAIHFNVTIKKAEMIFLTAMETLHNVVMDQARSDGYRSEE